MAEISVPDDTRSKIEELLGRANWRYCRVPPPPTEELEAEAESLAAPYAYDGESALLQVGYEKEEPLKCAAPMGPQENQLPQPRRHGLPYLHAAAADI